MTTINSLITQKTQEEILKHSYIQIDRSEFQGQTYSSAPFYKQFNTDQYLFEVAGTVDITWINNEEYDFYRVSSISITMYDDLGEVFPDDFVFDVFENNLQFSII